MIISLEPVTKDNYVPENAAARVLYASLGFVETGEMDDDEIIARWTAS